MNGFSHLCGETEESIQEQILRIMDIPLPGYRYVSDLTGLKIGRYIRWINGDKLTNGGVVVGVYYTDNMETCIRCKLSGRVTRFVNLKWDETHIFQKLGLDENLYLRINSY